MNITKLLPADRGSIHNPVFTGQALFSNGEPGTKRLDSFRCCLRFQ